MQTLTHYDFQTSHNFLYLLWGEQTFAPYPTPPTPLLTRARTRKRAHAREQFNK